MTSNEAMLLLEKAREKVSDDYWIRHSICVGNSAGKIAEALNLDVDYAKTLGYIHDIGKSVGDFKNHIINGCKYIKSLGYGYKYANICLTHSYLNNDVNCVASGTDNDIILAKFIKEYQYTIYDKIINLCDLMCTDVNLTIDKRIIDIIIRRGTFENTQYHIIETYKLKKYIDDLLGFDVYDLFPDIHNNL